MLELGIQPGDRVAILSENRPEWAIADYACLTARCTDVPIYPTLPAKQVEYVLRDSGSVAVLVSTRHQLEKVLAIREHLPDLRHVIAFEPDARAPASWVWMRSTPGDTPLAHGAPIGRRTPWRRGRTTWRRSSTRPAPPESRRA